MCSSHAYGDAAAAVTAKTAGGTLHLCNPCLTTLLEAGFVRFVGPLRSENPRQRCQCEHADHFSNEALTAEEVARG